MGLPAVNLSEKEDDQFFEIINNIELYGEPFYEFTEAAPVATVTEPKAVKRTRRVSAKKPSSKGAAKAATA